MKQLTCASLHAKSSMASRSVQHFELCLFPFDILKKKVLKYIHIFDHHPQFCPYF